MLGLGYAVASSSLNVFGNNCNELLAAETMMMTKERFIEAYGPPRWTFGFGCSGGSYQQHQIGDNYPGLLQGIIPGCSFPEVGFATIYMISDSWLLDNYFKNNAPGLFTPEQQRAVAGVLTLNTLANVAVGARRIDPRVFCGVVPAADRYHPATNPIGRALRRVRPHRERLRPRPGDRVRPPAARQRRRPVRPQGAQRRGRSRSTSSSP